MNRTRLGATVAAVGALCLSAVAPATAHSLPAAPAAPKAHSHARQCVQPRVVIDHLGFDALPCESGTMSVFDSFDDADITTAVWENTDSNGTAVAMMVSVFRSPQFRSGAVFHQWVVDWQQRPAAEAVDHLVRTPRGPRWLSADEVVWSPRPGVGISIRVDRARHRDVDLLKVADRVLQLRR